MKKPSMPKPQLPKIDFRKLAEDFKTMDPKEPGQWPLIPKALILAAVFVGLIAVAYLLGWSTQLEELDAARQKEASLKSEWLDKKKQAVNLEAHRKQLAEIDRSFGELLKQLPNKAEMDAMIVDISQAALTRGLKVELFKPGNEARRDFYAELPISLILSGAYNDLAAFAGDTAALPRIVTLNNIKVRPKDPKNASLLNMDAIAMTYRYLDPDEVAALKKQQKPGGKGGK
jgi:type IV pilus assembly protein PilO